VPIWGRFMKKTRGQKSRATVPLSQKNFRRKAAVSRAGLIAGLSRAVEVR
jgi:hypothetical protein